MKRNVSIILLLSLTACGDIDLTANVSNPTSESTNPTIASSGDSITSDNQGGQTPLVIQPDPTPSASPSASPSTIPLRFYSLTKQLATGGGNTINGTGNCVVYQSKTYCWDDGVKQLGATSVKMSFFGINDTVHACITSCTSDVMNPNPIKITQTLLDQFTVAGTYGSNYQQRTPSNVISTGTPTDVLCTENNGSLNCVNFTIDLNQIDL